jgi:hypothetical protein
MVSYQAREMRMSHVWSFELPIICTYRSNLGGAVYRCIRDHRWIVMLRGVCYCRRSEADGWCWEGIFHVTRKGSRRALVNMSFEVFHCDVFKASETVSPCSIMV